MERIMTPLEIRLKALELAVATIANRDYTFECFMARAEKIEEYILSAKQE